MALSAAIPRKHIHRRSIEFHGHLRDDGLWDIEAELKDVRGYAYRSRDSGEKPEASMVHNMLLRVTVDDQMTVIAIETGMPATPFPECPQVEQPMQRLVGARLGSGWRRTIDAAIGGVNGCTHMRELLFNLATAAFQTVPVYRMHQRRDQGLPLPRFTKPLPHFGKCMSWDFNGPVMQRVAPEFYRWSEPKE